MTPTDIAALAAEIKDAQDNGRQITPVSGRTPEFDMTVAYDVARHIHEARMKDGVIPVGRKIGFTNRTIWSQLGIDEPVWGYLYDTTVVLLDDLNGDCSLEGLPEPKIEPEIVFRLQDSLDPEMTLYELVDAIDWVAHGVEIVRSSYPDWQFQAADAVADSAFHARLFVGPTLPLSELGNEPVTTLAAFQLDLSCDGQHVETGNGADVLGNPLSALLQLVQLLSDNPGAEPLQAGEIVTTGTITAAHSIEAGQRWRTDLREIPLPGLTLDMS